MYVKVDYCIHLTILFSSFPSFCFFSFFLFRSVQTSVQKSRVGVVACGGHHCNNNNNDIIIVFLSSFLCCSFLPTIFKYSCGCPFSWCMKSIIYLLFYFYYFFSLLLYLFSFRMLGGWRHQINIIMVLIQAFKWQEFNMV